jgi:hypothetical protein
MIIHQQRQRVNFALILEYAQRLNLLPLTTITGWKLDSPLAGIANLPNSQPPIAPAMLRYV